METSTWDEDGVTNLSISNSVDVDSTVIMSVFLLHLNIMMDKHTHLCTWCQSPVVVLGSVWSIRSWGLVDALLCPGWAAHGRVSSRGRKSLTERLSAPCSRNAACSQLWNWRRPRSRCDAATLQRARRVVAAMMVMMMMMSAVQVDRKPATAPEPESAELSERTSPFLLLSELILRGNHTPFILNSTPLFIPRRGFFTPIQACLLIFTSLSMLN